MRSIAKGLGLGSAAMALTALTALAWPGTAGAAPAGTESLYAPSALVLSVSAGPDADAGAALRAVTLVCSPTPGGTHPSRSPRAASYARTARSSTRSPHRPPTPCVPGSGTR